MTKCECDVCRGKVKPKGLSMVTVTYDDGTTEVINVRPNGNDELVLVVKKHDSNKIAQHLACSGGLLMMVAESLMNEVISGIGIKELAELGRR